MDTRGNSGERVLSTERRSHDWQGAARTEAFGPIHRTIEECRVGKTELRIPEAAEGAGEKAQEGREIEASPGTARGSRRRRSSRHPARGRQRPGLGSRRALRRARPARLLPTSSVYPTRPPRSGTASALNSPEDSLPRHFRAPATVRLSLALDHDFEIFARQHQRAIARAIAACDESTQVLGESGLLVGSERGECLVHRAIVRAEYVDPVRR